MGAFLRLDVAGVFGIVVGQNREFNRKSNMYSNQIGNVILKIVYLKKNIMKKIIYLLFAVALIGCSDNDSTSSSEPVLGVDDLSLVLNGQILKHRLDIIGRGDFLYIDEYGQNGSRNTHEFRGALEPLQNNESPCWRIDSYEGDSVIRIESPNYIEYLNGENITLDSNGKLYWKSSLTATFVYEMFESSLEEIEALKEEVVVECD